METSQQQLRDIWECFRDAESRNVHPQKNTLSRIKIVYWKKEISLKNTNKVQRSRRLRGNGLWAHAWMPSWWLYVSGLTEGLAEYNTTFMMFREKTKAGQTWGTHMNPATNVSDSPAAPPPYAELVSPSQTDFPGDASFTFWAGWEETIPVKLRTHPAQSCWHTAQRYLHDFIGL